MKKVGNYVLLSELGKGQFGVVSKAQHNDTKEIYAIKAIAKAGIQGSPKMKELFDTEVKIMSNIKHPNIMHLYELLETGNNYYLVLDYCRSGDMEHYVKKHKGLGEEEATYLLMQVMNGFKELHKHKIMHRDFKLANIFLSDDRVVIGDFGFAKSGQDMAATKLGSPITMAPEILLNKSGKIVYTNKADLWSIGVCYFEMIYGVEPWPNVRSVEDLCNKVSQFSGPRLQFPPNSRFKVSQECKQLLISLIELDPRRRIDWNAFYNHQLFRNHQQKRASGDMMKSIMFRNNEDTVKKLFDQNRRDDGSEYELIMEPNKINGFPNAQFGHAIGAYMDPGAIAERNRAKILDRFTHEKRIMVFLIHTSVRLRNLSKDKTNLQRASDGLMYCGILLLKKTILLNFYALDALKRNYNIFEMQGFENFLKLPDRQRLMEELEQIDIPTYQKLFSHLLQKIKSEMVPLSARTMEVCSIVENASPQILDRVEQELRREGYFLTEFQFQVQHSLPVQTRLELQSSLACLYVCSRHKEQMPFISEGGVPFDWHLFEKSWEGVAGTDKISKLLQRAVLEK